MRLVVVSWPATRRKIALERSSSSVSTLPASSTRASSLMRLSSGCRRRRATVARRYSKKSRALVLISMEPRHRARGVPHQLGEVGRPFELIAVLDPDAEHLGDDDGRQREREVLDEIDPIRARERGEQLVGYGLDVAAEGAYRRGREGLVDQATNPRVIGRIDEFFICCRIIA